MGIRMKLKRLKTKQVLKLVMSLGWYFDSQKGSHKHYKHPLKKGKITIPDHGDLDIGTLRSIFGQAGISSF